MLTNKHPTEVVNSPSVFTFDLREGCEVEVHSAPKERFTWELVLTLEMEPCSNVVILLDAFDLPPE